MTTNDPFFLGGRWSSKSLMEHSGLSCTLHMPKARKSTFGAGGVELSQSLPEGNPRAAFLVDDYPASPTDWMRSEPGLSSYIVPVKEEHGLWLDFNDNARNSHDVAVIVSAQGVNALTCQKTDKARLEQYREKCPLHGTPFVGTRRCNHPDCKGMEWPAQNYLSSNAQPTNYFWLDGFMAQDRVTRQFVFTEDVSRSIANAVLGAERVHAIGIMFFLSKNPKPRKPEPTYRSKGLSFGADGGTTLESLGAESYSPTRSATRGGGGFRSVTPTKKFELAAGAKIDQKIYPDTEELTYWEDAPAGLIVINYTDADTLQRILEQGSDTNREGPLGRLDVRLGN